MSSVCHNIMVATDIFSCAAFRIWLVSCVAASMDLLQVGSEVGAFELWVVLAVDEDDPYYGKSAHRNDVKAYFQARVTEPLMLLGVKVSLTLIAFDNHAHKPGPAFNVAAAAAFVDGADFFFRLNDDTVLPSEEKWVSALVESLLHNNPPLLGVTGPRCASNMANGDILTHDFVHRTHLEIFPTYCKVFVCTWCTTTTGRLTI